MWGQPTKYNPKYCQELITFARKPEGSFNAFAAKILVSRETLDEWARVHKPFSDAKKAAKRLNEAAMVDIGLRGMNGRNGQGSWQSAWIFAMKARHGWREEGAEDQEDTDLVIHTEDSNG